jgi:hypothetical protein
MLSALLVLSPKILTVQLEVRSILSDAVVAMTVDLGQARQGSGAEMQIGGYVADFTRQLFIETSLDGQRWSPVWNGGTALLAFSAALQDQDPVALTLPPKFESRTRYIRFTQTGTAGIYPWSVAELRVLGSR